MAPAIFGGYNRRPQLSWGEDAPLCRVRLTAPFRLRN
jgi:hypothetical protein